MGPHGWQDTVERELLAQQEGETHAVETEDLPGGPFFRCVQQGGQRVLYLNVAHPFYTVLYAGPESTPRLRAGLEIILWALGEAEVDAEPESPKRHFYGRERASVWSPYIDDALSVLKTIAVVEEIDAPTPEDEPEGGDSLASIVCSRSQRLQSQSGSLRETPRNRGGARPLATGTVKWFSAEKGCGFIVPDGGGTALFVDYREIVGADHKTLVENTKVRFEAAEGEYGPEAKNVTFSSA